MTLVCRCAVKKPTKNKKKQNYSYCSLDFCSETVGGPEPSSLMDAYSHCHSECVLKPQTNNNIISTCSGLITVGGITLLASRRLSLFGLLAKIKVYGRTRSCAHV